MKVVLLNGPPRSGKDTIGEMLSRVLVASFKAKFAKPIVDYMLTAHNIRMEEVDKDALHPNLYGRTPREVAIAYSEQFCKPVFGFEYFGLQAVQYLKDFSFMDRDGEKAVAIFTDSGFPAEAGPVVQHVGVNNVIKVKLMRPGCHFEGDSRSHWEAYGIRSLPFSNDGNDKSELYARVNSELVHRIRDALHIPR